ncbi:CNDP dipeptidase [Fomitiporia mediterranea MF3/22]|uniref:CNDP dipeptidase n=1 Tax=Fomitiporia mediterranea (strain MF3/22) TaxID=694068 RepID=UPI0004407E42|nr:CNDP dipeptidase [Fomitiporia mediterranea MF3/22]EJD05311.1 CNDP dipeptidase [Fomitiporia mediterranea MF3/22]
MPAPSQFLGYVDANAEKFIKRLADAVAIPSVSADASYRPHVFRMAEFLANELKSVGCEVKAVPLGKQVLDGQEIDLPPALLASIGNDPSKKTILCYGHFDVQPALKSDGWDTEPFQLVVDEKTGRLIGRGSTDDKGPVLGWVNILQAHKELGIPLPVNLKFCFEGMEENGSEGLDELIAREALKGGFFDGVEAVCISDNYWLNTRTPCLTYGLRGICYYKLTISGPARDLHSGAFGRTVHEPMTDLIAVLGKLVAPNGDILIPGVNELVAPLTQEERKRYESIDYGVQDIEQSIGAKIAISDDKAAVLMGRMRYPSLSIHGIEGAFSAPGAKTVIPARVSGKFSIRLVPDQTPEAIDPFVFGFVRSEFAKLGSKNTMSIENLHGGKPWVTDPNHWNYLAAIRATQAVYKVQPDLTREGGSIPVTLTFAEKLGVNVLLLPMGRGDDGAHSTNEKLDRSNYIEGTKLLGSYLYEVGEIKKT